jgi:hypothetical protein
MEAQRLCTRDECFQRVDSALSDPSYRLDAGNRRKRRIHIATTFESLIGIDHSRFAKPVLLAELFAATNVPDSVT